MTTATETASRLRAIIKDYNYWPTSESDSPLKVGTAKGSLDDKKLLSLDGSYRRKANESNPAYQMPVRTVMTIPFDATFINLIDDAISNLQGAKDNFDSDPINLLSLELAAESVEFAVQLYSVFKELTNPSIKEISTTSESTVGLVVSGEVGTGLDLRTVFATASLVRT